MSEHLEILKSLNTLGLV
ncbi:integrating conjugative element protein, partial [Escherichia coli]|nr:integrating conjugative element protein [Escherichia coli]